MPNLGSCVIEKKDDAAVLKIVRDALRNNKINYSKHALDQMDARAIKVSEVEEIIKYGNRESGLDELDRAFNYWRYVIRNRNVEDRDLAISVDIEDEPDVILVTVMQVDPVVARKL